MLPLPNGVNFAVAMPSRSSLFLEAKPQLAQLDPVFSAVYRMDDGLHTTSKKVIPLYSGK